MRIITRGRADQDGDDDGQAGQASVELLALLPALGLIVALAVQALVAGTTWWLASVAAREGARASALGRDPTRAAAAAVPSPWRASSRVAVSAADDATVTVRLAIPTLLGGLRIGSAVGRARMEPQR
jgi:pilus assembly protein CpaE